MRDMRFVFGRVDSKCCCVQKSDGLVVNERRKAALPSESRRKSHSAASAKTLYTTSITTFLNSRTNDHFYEPEHTSAWCARRTSQM
jgi:hypothetical protein